MTEPATRAASPAEIEQWLKSHIAALIGTAPDQISSEAGFESFGIDSVQSVDMVTELENWLQLPDELPIELLFEERTIADAATRVAALQSTGTAQS